MLQSPRVLLFCGSAADALTLCVSDGSSVAGNSYTGVCTIGVLCLFDNPNARTKWVGEQKCCSLSVLQSPRYDRPREQTLGRGHT